MSEQKDQIPQYAGPASAPPAHPPVPTDSEVLTDIVEDAEAVGPTVEIGRNGRLTAVVGGLAAVVALAFLIRHHGPVDVVVGLVLAALAAGQLWSAWDSRTPLLVADPLGVRLRLGRAWQGMPWSDLEEVEHQPRTSWWRDGRLVLLPRQEQAQVEALSAAARRHTRVSTALYGAPFALPLGLTTTVLGGGAELSSWLAGLAGEATTVVEIDPGIGAEEDPADVSSTISETAERPLVASPTPSPLREPTVAVRAEISRDRDLTVLGANALRIDHDESGRTGSELPEVGELRRAEDPYVGLDAEPFVELAEDGPELALDPIIGPDLAAARERIGLSVDQLAERTRIRPHVIEAIEVDDFAPCGGDFYARGHLRTLARVLGVDAGPLLASYDTTYADSPIDARRVFEAELATGAGGPIRRLKGGPNWSVLVAAVMAIVLAWSIARLVFNDSSKPTDSAISLSSGSAGTTNPYGNAAAAVPVVITAASGGAEVVVRDGKGDVVFNGSLAFGESKTLQASPPVRVQSSDGSVTVSVDGAAATALGETGAAAQQTYTASK
ncbi:RodZ domain-containing protein [Nocardioides sp.]|uniref:helix-turn-helix domain-containing protein n=1 Tax=Nocardioides sp. TaxID=35761 RepID=UPI0039E509FD